MALRGRRIDNFLELWWLVASGEVDVWVSSTSFQKSNISWPQQPPTKKVVNFNMIFHESTKSIFFQNIKIKLNSRTCMTLKSSVVIFQTFEPLKPQWPLQPKQPPWPQWPLQIDLLLRKPVYVTLLFAIKKTVVWIWLYFWKVVICGISAF